MKVVMLRLRLLALLLCIGLCLLALTETQAQAELLPLAYGERVTGELTPPTLETLYAFAGAQGDMVSIAMNALEGSVDPFLILLDGAQQNVIGVDNEGGGTGANGKGNARLRAVLPSTGVWVIKATTAQKSDATRGTFELTLMLENPAPTPSASANAPIIAPYEAGLIYRADLNDTTPFHLYRVQATKDTVLALALEVEGDLQAGLYLYDPTFESRLATAELGQPLNAVIPADGVYFLVVGRIAAQGAGAFTLRELNPEGAASISPGQTVRGQISAERPARTYPLSGAAGQPIRVQMRRLSGDLLPLVYIVATESGSVVAQSAPSATGDGSSAELSLTLAADGVYAIVATREGQASGLTTGDYLLAVTTAETAGVAAAGATEIIPDALRDYAPFAYGEEFRGAIDADNVGAAFRFYGTQGDEIEVTLEAGRGLDPLLILQSDVGDTLAQSEPGAGDAVALSFTLPRTGWYGILATREGINSGSSSGDFTLRLTLRSATATPTPDDRPALGTLLVGGQTLSGDLTSRLAALYRLEVTANATARLDVVADGEVMTLLADENFVQIAVAYGSLRETALPRAGTYYVLVVRRFGPNDPAGRPFSVVLGGGLVPPTIAPTAPPAVLGYGQQVSGRLTNEAYAVRYVLYARAGESARVAMNAAAGSALNPMVALLDASGNLLIVNDDAAPGLTDALFIYDFAADGTYTILATRSGEATGTTSGAFTLRVDLPQPTPTPAPTTENADSGIPQLVYGSRVSGSIKAAPFVVYYRFAGTAGDVVTIQMGHGAGSGLDPALYLYYYDAGGNRVAVAFNDNQSAGTLNAAIERFTLPQTGEYLIIATRAGVAQGATTGSFVLVLAKDN
jgi:hypothetical protein